MRTPLCCSGAARARSFLPWMMPLVVAGCASLTPHRAPTAQELSHVAAVEVDAIAADTAVDHEAPKGAPDPRGRRDPPRIALGLPTERAIATTLVEAGPSQTRLPFLRAGERRDPSSSARLEVWVDSVTLASGDGPDPLTVLWVRFRTRLSLPRMVRVVTDESGATHRALSGSGRLGPAWVLAADPRPRRLSEWEADGGALVKTAVASLVAQAAPRLLADLRGGAGPVASQGPSAGGGGSETALADAPAPRVQVEFRSRAPGDGTGLKLAAGLGGFVVGGVAGAFYGLGTCAEAVGGGGKEIGAIIVAACAVVAMPVGAIVGTFVGAAKGVDLASKHVAKDEAAWRAEQARKVGALGAAASPVELAPALSAGLQARGETAGTPAAAPALLGAVVVRLVEVGGAPPRSQLELDLTLRGGGEQEGRERRVCMRGPGPVPTALWLEREPGLLRGAVEAQLARAAELGLLGIEPREGDGPCAK